MRKLKIPYQILAPFGPESLALDSSLTWYPIVASRPLGESVRGTHTTRRYVIPATHGESIARFIFLAASSSYTYSLLSIFTLVLFEECAYHSCLHT